MLKQAREAKNLSLADVSDTTFISIRFLEAIEAGKTDILPQAYVRAFIREYATVVGLDAAEVMRRYDSIGSGSAQAARPSIPPERSAPAASVAPTTTAAPPPSPEPVPQPQASPAPEVSPPPQQEPAAEEPPSSAPRRDLTDIIQKNSTRVSQIIENVLQQQPAWRADALS